MDALLIYYFPDELGRDYGKEKLQAYAGAIEKPEGAPAGDPICSELSRIAKAKGPFSAKGALYLRSGSYELGEQTAYDALFLINADIHADAGLRRFLSATILPLAKGKEAQVWSIEPGDSHFLEESVGALARAVKNASKLAWRR
jgi:hypothetical protein